jgi:hypothetical protein
VLPTTRKQEPSSNKGQTKQNRRSPGKQAQTKKLENKKEEKISI